MAQHVLVEMPSKKGMKKIFFWFRLTGVTEAGRS